jgi:hypothetical protein
MNGVILVAITLDDQPVRFEDEIVGCPHERLGAVNNVISDPDNRIAHAGCLTLPNYVVSADDVVGFRTAAGFDLLAAGEEAAE